MTLRWFSSKAVRQATEVCDRVRKLLNAQRDLLPAPAAQTLTVALAETQAVTAGKADAEVIRKAAGDLERVADKCLRPYPYPGFRENVDVVLVALAVAMAIRTFFLQPMAIPTGSMQPTLYGITAENLRGQPNAPFPNAIGRFFGSMFNGIRFFRITARSDGAFAGFEKPEQVFPFVSQQKFHVGSEVYSVWFPPEGFENLSGLARGDSFHVGEDILKLKVKSGDRLFADRLTYNFRRPRRGEIVIFETTGIQGLQQGTHYIKRLIATGGEHLRILDDRHVEIDGRRVDAAIPGFETLYSFNGPPAESQYSGHVNGTAALHFGFDSRIAPLFPDEATVREIEPRHYFVLGDNTLNSYDWRSWGTFPEEKIVGRCGFVFWPISDRFGWGFR